MITISTVVSRGLCFQMLQIEWLKHIVRVYTVYHYDIPGKMAVNA